MLFIFEESGALSFCSKNYVYKPHEEIEDAYSKMVSNLNYSDLNQRYFQSYFLLGANDSNFSFSKVDGKVSPLGNFNINYYHLMNFDLPNAFNTNYQKFYRFDKTKLTNIKTDSGLEKEFQEFVDYLDGKFVYYTIRDNTLCLFVFNDDAFNSIFHSAKATNTAVVLKNSSGNIIYSTPEGADNVDFDRNYTDKNEIFELYIKTNITFSLTDIIFILFILFLSGSIIFIITRYSDLYASKIMEPYRILNNFFRMNKNAEEFEMPEFNSSTRKRNIIIRIFYKAYLYTILIPSILSLTFSTIALHVSTRHFSHENVMISHSHLTNELYSNFDFFTANNITKTDNSHFNYTVVLDDMHNIKSHPFVTINHSNLHLFSKTVRPLAKKVKTGMLVYINNDLFGEKAIGIFKVNSEDEITLNVIKTENIDNVSFHKTVDFILADANGNIIIQSPFNQTSFEKCCSFKSKYAFEKHKFDEYDWTLYTFANHKENSQQIGRVILLNIVTILGFLLVLALFTWYSSISFTNPIEYIISSISNYSMNNRKEKLDIPYNNEIEELLAMYNIMLDRIEKITKENIAISIEKEQLKTIKAQAELNALQHQINPHFLYNTLQAIGLNISSYNTNEILVIISSLSNIYRYATSNSKSFYLCDEFENLRNYIYIWQALFPDRFNVEYDIHPESEIVPSLKLILQPIVENAFIHGFKNQIENCNLNIKTRMDNEFVYISISDNGCGMDKETLDELMEKIKGSEPSSGKKGIGIKNVYQRLKIYYGDSFDLNIESTPHSGTTITLKFSVYNEYFDE